MVKKKDPSGEAPKPPQPPKKNPRLRRRGTGSIVTPKTGGGAGYMGTGPVHPGSRRR